MGLHATSSSLAGSLRQDVLVDGRFRLATDEPRRLGGTDSAPSPHELLPAALAACVATTLRLAAPGRGWRLGRVEVDVDYDPHATPRSCEVVIRTEYPLAGAQLGRLAKVAATCPVRRALEGGGTVFTERIEPAAAGRTPLRLAG
jgi:putative redox protein